MSLCSGKRPISLMEPSQGPQKCPGLGVSCRSPRLGEHLAQLSQDPQILSPDQIAVWQEPLPLPPHLGHNPEACEGRRKRKWPEGEALCRAVEWQRHPGEPRTCIRAQVRMDSRTSRPEVLGVLGLLALSLLSLVHFLGPCQPVDGPSQSQGPHREAARLTQQDACRITLVESIPQDLWWSVANRSAQPLDQAWLQLLNMAQESVHVASFYWSLTGRDIGVNDSSSQPGETILQELQRLLGRNVSLAVATSASSLAPNSTDLQGLAARGAQVRQVPMRQLTGGVLHSKFWVVDGRHIYVGSANMDWRALTQVKELGVVIHNCSRLAQDLEKTFQTYWALGTARPEVPKHWPHNFSTHINRLRPLRGHFGGLLTTAYFSASPPVLCPRGRTRDLDALLTELGHARKFIYVSVMEYFPTTRFRHPARYWPVLDTALRTAAVSRGVRVRLLVSCWLNTDPSMFPFLRSLQALSHPEAGISLDVKVYIVPVGNHSNIPFSRVNHSKFMVTERAAYVGTSNWSEDYFSSTSGVGLVLSQKANSSQPGVLTVQEQLRRLFERDWSSPYAVGLDSPTPSKDCVWRG